MLLRGKCPGCGDNKEYIAELVGSETDCMKCGHRFVLKDNPGRVTWHILTATLAVLVLVGGIGGRMYMRSQRWQRGHDRPANGTTYRITFGADNPDN